MTVHAESEKGFDGGRLQNGVIEPLEEADLIEQALLAAPGEPGLALWGGHAGAGVSTHSPLH